MLQYLCGILKPTENYSKFLNQTENTTPVIVHCFVPFTFSLYSGLSNVVLEV